MTKDCWRDIFHSDKVILKMTETPDLCSTSMALEKWVWLAYTAQLNSSHNTSVFRAAQYNLGNCC